MRWTVFQSGEAGILNYIVTYHMYDSVILTQIQQKVM